MATHLSPQARNRLLNCLHGQEWIDLAAEIAEAIEEADPFKTVTLGEHERAIILEALKGGADDPLTLESLARDASTEHSSLIAAIKALRINHEDAGLGPLTLLEARNAVYDAVGRPR